MVQTPLNLLRPYTSILDVIPNLNEILPIAIDNLYNEKEQNLDVILNPGMDLEKCARRIMSRIWLCRSNITHTTRIGPSDTVYLSPKYYDLIHDWANEKYGTERWPDPIQEHLILPTNQIGDHILVARIWGQMEVENITTFNSQFHETDRVGTLFYKQFSGFRIIDRRTENI